MIQKITWNELYGYIQNSGEKVDEAIIDGLHLMFEQLGGGSLFYNGIPEGLWGYELSPNPDGTALTIDEIVEYTVANFSADDAHVVQRLLNGLLLQRNCSKAALKQVASITTRVPKQSNKGESIYEASKQLGSTNEEELYPALGLLCRLVKEAVKAEKTAKYILLPQKAAMKAGVMLPQIDAKWYNNQFGTKLNKMDISRWINGAGNCEYISHEINPVIERFKAFK